ncbi:MAG: hypothetical protein LBV30_05435 [Propionibacteriaceae bacterium]|nr:hypothetical protein [Propionibacteriaceae bacterium]
MTSIPILEQADSSFNDRPHCYTGSMTVDTTLIRIPSPLRDRVREEATRRHETFGEVIAHGLDLIDEEHFWSKVSDLQPDTQYRDELLDWDGQDMR